MSDNMDMQELSEQARKLQMLKNSNQQRDALNKMANGQKRWTEAEVKSDQAKAWRFFRGLLISIGGLSVVIVILAADLGVWRS